MIPQVEIVGREAFASHRTLLLEPDGAAWLTFARPWWDLASWIWWLCMPGERKWVLVRRDDGRRVRIRAVRVARRHVRLS